MITGLRRPTRRTIASRPRPSRSFASQDAQSLRSALGPGYQLGASERVVRQALRR